MTKTRQVDLGPMYMPVGEETLPAPTPPATVEDKARFARLIDGNFADEAEAERTALQESLEAKNRRAAQAQEGQGERSLPEQFEALWIEQASPLRREVRVGWGNQILPGMAIRMYEQAGVLGVEVHASPTATTGWLMLRTPTIVRDLSLRMRRPVRLAIFESDGTLSAHSSWPQGDQA